MKEKEHKANLDDLFIYYVEREETDDPRNLGLRKGD
jgi:hypothetical protein